MKTNYTHITLVVDRSGSMQGIAKDAQGGINKFVIDQRREPGEATFYLAQFDTKHDDVFGPDNLAKFNSYTLHPRGGTAMYDAIGKAIVTTGEYLDKMAEQSKPAKVVFCIVTDGEENSSVEWDQAKVKALITEHTDKYNWQFVFIGANIDAYQTGTAMGVHSTTAFASTGASTRGVYANLSQTVSTYRGAPVAASMGVVASVGADGEDVETVTP